MDQVWDSRKQSESGLHEHGAHKVSFFRITGTRILTITRKILDDNPELRRTWEGLTPMGELVRTHRPLVRSLDMDGLLTFR